MLLASGQQSRQWITWLCSRWCAEQIKKDDHKAVYVRNKLDGITVVVNIDSIAYNICCGRGRTNKCDLGQTAVCFNHVLIRLMTKTCLKPSVAFIVAQLCQRSNSEGTFCQYSVVSAADLMLIKRKMKGKKGKSSVFPLCQWRKFCFRMGVGTPKPAARDLAGY